MVEVCDTLPNSDYSGDNLHHPMYPHLRPVVSMYSMWHLAVFKGSSGVMLAVIAQVGEPQELKERHISGRIPSSIKIPIWYMDNEPLKGHVVLKEHGCLKSSPGLSAWS